MLELDDPITHDTTPYVAQVDWRWGLSLDLLHDPHLLVIGPSHRHIITILNRQSFTN